MNERYGSARPNGDTLKGYVRLWNSGRQASVIRGLESFSPEDRRSFEALLVTEIRVSGGPDVERRANLARIAARGDALASQLEAIASPSRTRGIR